MTCSQSRNCCFFRYFLERYLRYLFERAVSDETRTLALSRETDTRLPRLPVLPPTLILSVRNFSCRRWDYGRKSDGDGGATRREWAWRVTDQIRLLAVY